MDNFLGFMMDHYPVTTYLVIYGLVVLLALTLVDRMCALVWNYGSFVRDWRKKE